MREVSSIELVLENCEVIRVKRENIGVFRIFNVQRHITRLAVNSISESLEAQEVVLQISSKENNTEAYSHTWSTSKTAPFRRLTNVSDVAAIDVIYKDGSSSYIFVPWKDRDDNDTINSYQTSKVNKHTGDLYLVISENKIVKDYFVDYLEDTDPWYWELYSEGE